MIPRTGKLAHSPESVTFRKNVIVIPSLEVSDHYRPKCHHDPPSVSVRATINNEKGGRWSLAFKVAKTTDKITYGTTILNICSKPNEDFSM
jgi:hypothetical protein